MSTRTTKPIIYQVLTRLFTNYCENPVPNGTLAENGSGKLNDISSTVLKAVKNLGATHIWYTGVIEHAHDADYTSYGIARHNPHVIKGHAGSPYAITDYYDIDPDLAEDVPSRMAEFEALVERTHNAGLKAIIDFVPNHVGREYHSDARPEGTPDLGEGDNQGMFFSPSNNFYYITGHRFTPMVDMGYGEGAYNEFPAKATGDDCFNATPGPCNWYDTIKLNYGVDYSNGSHHFDPVPSTWSKMLDILLFWASKGIDGFRCDMVHMVPLDFWHWAIPQVRQQFPGIVFIAEIYDIGLYRPFIEYGGFDYLYDKVNLYDTLRAIETQGHSADSLTGSWQTVDGIAHNMLNFLENHDEQRFASSFYAGDAKRVVPSLVVSTLISTGPMMIYFGQELGETGMDAEGYSGCDGRTTIFDYWSVAKVRRWLSKGTCRGRLSPEEKSLRALYSRILNLANDEPAIAVGSFYDLMYVNHCNHGLDPRRHFVFLRHEGDDTLVVAVNFSDTAADVAVKIPQHAFDFLNLPQGTDPKATELITAIKEAKTISASEPFTAHLPAHGAAIWKLSSSRIIKAAESAGVAPEKQRKTTANTRTRTTKRKTSK